MNTFHVNRNNIYIFFFEISSAVWKRIQYSAAAAVMCVTTNPLYNNAVPILL